MADKNAVGSTLGFVIARGFTQVGRFPALLGFDGSKRLSLNCLPMSTAQTFNPQGRITN